MPWIWSRGVGRARGSMLGDAQPNNLARPALLAPQAYGGGWQSRARTIGAPASRAKIFILSHVPERFESVPDWPELERVLLPALPLEDELRTNLIGEGRAFLAELDTIGTEYIGCMNARAPTKYGAAGADPGYWRALRARVALLEPGVVLAPYIAPPEWAAYSGQVHPGMALLLQELQELTGLPLETGRSSLWANDMVMHHSVWTDWLSFWRRCFGYFHGRWGWDWPSFRVPDLSRGPAYFAERWTTLYFANRPDLTIERL